MKLLLDENLPRDLKQEFPEHEISTVRENGWSGKSNGELLQLMIDHGFECLLTFERNIQHQQNFEKYPIAVILLIASSNKLQVLRPLVGQIKVVLEQLAPGVIAIQN